MCFLEGIVNVTRLRTSFEARVEVAFYQLKTFVISRIAAVLNVDNEVWEGVKKMRVVRKKCVFWGVGGEIGQK